MIFSLSLLSTMQKSLSIIILLFSLVRIDAGNASVEQPNIIWIVVEDMSCHFGYQGQAVVKSPNVNRLAREGVVFSNAYITAPVCSAARSAMITGMFQTTIGAHHHRSSRGKLKIELPKNIRTIPELFRDAGYYTCNLAFDGSEPERYDRVGKEDYNFAFERKNLYDGPSWSGRKSGQPFFAQIQLRGGKLRNVPRWYDEVKNGLDDLVTTNEVRLPPYYPKHSAFLEDWATYLNSVQYTDIEVGLIIDQLSKEKLLDNTIIFFLTDHGISQARGKQFAYDEGAKIPFIVWAPKRILKSKLNPEKRLRSEPVSHIDMSATSLDLAGIPIPNTMQGRTLFGVSAKPRDFVVVARDRCDETADRIRAIRQGNFKYIRNYFPNRPYLQPCAYKDAKPFMKPLRELYAAGRLDPVQSLHLAEVRPKEELYDLTADPFEVKNLALDLNYSDRLKEFRATLESWETTTNDQGRTPEPAAMYDSDMNAYLNPRMRKNKPEYVAEVEKNIAIMKRWQAAGK